MDPNASALSIVLTTAPDAETGARIARALVAEGLAACVNVVPGLRSFYRWKGVLQDDPEVLLVAKVATARLDAYEARLRTLHPYELPEIVALAAAQANRAYLDWCLGAERGGAI